MMRGKFSKTKRHKFWPFLLGMVLYAVIFLTATYFGLGRFWSYMEAYENSRPQNTLNAYVSRLGDAEVYQESSQLLSQVDSNLQTEEDCHRLLSEAISDGITCAKKVGDSTAERYVYALRSGGRTIGSLTMVVTAEDDYGFSLWSVTNTSFDFSFLLGTRQSITVPEDFTVWVGDVALSDAYRTQSDLHYSELDDFYEDYDIPALVTYEAGPILGELTFRVTDRNGEDVLIDESTDYSVFLDNCSEEKSAEVKDFSKEFLQRYVAFTGSALKSSQKSYRELIGYLVPGSDLAQRMAMALEGLEWAQSRGDTLVETTFHHIIDVGNGHYLCDVTYQVDTTGREGVVRTTNSARFVLVESNGSYLVETLLSY